MGYVYVTGELNARTGDRNDYITDDFFKCCTWWKFTIYTRGQPSSLWEEKQDKHIIMLKFVSDM